MLIEFIVAIVTSFALSVVLSYYIIPILKGHKVGQIIREEGPSWHSSKAGTPTMGGICFIMAILIVSAGFTVFYTLKNRQSELIPLALTLGLGVFNGLIGFVDDYCKLLKKQNEGLTPLQKIILQTLVAILYILALRFTGHLDTNLFIPFLKTNIELGFVYYIFAVFLILGMVNSVNLTDGIDGLATSVTLVVAGFFAFVAFNVFNESLILISGLLIGALIGFLVFNIHPAKVFMGDTGSLFLGGMVTGAAFLMENPLIIVIAGGIYVVEAFSDIIQVGVFKLSGRKIRVFKMAPIHHHFEKCGWKEGKIVSIFSLVTALLCVAAWFSSF
ncbi:MAG: phospho-N-acetylmuramoyl-pentapeptide-transferase [Clostridia bacterium]|nr:phospho-N-acetylmuramoyl-pentapeptide-transferase [Clostridia bacterium]